MFLAQTESTLDTLAIVLGLVGGLALYLFGLGLLADGLKAAAGDGLRIILSKLTTNRFTGLVTGTIVTGIVQSSTVTTVLLVGFISAGLMTMTQSVGVVMGANIGSTVTAQIIAFKVTKLALVMVAVGYGLSTLRRWEQLRSVGRVIMALGIVFFGFNVMGDAANPLRTYEPIVATMGAMEHAVLGVLAGAVFSALVHSSAATMGIVIMLAGQGLITLEAGIALAFGANIGTCITAFLAAIGKPREAMRTAIVHILFNIAGVLLWIAFIDELAAAVVAISPKADQLAGVERMAAEAPRQIANAHTVFNVANAAIFIWFTAPIIWLVRKIVPERPGGEEDEIQAKYLDRELLNAPSLAIETVRPEIRRMGKRVARMLDLVPHLIAQGGRGQFRQIHALDDEVDLLHGYIITFLGEISREQLSRGESHLVGALTTATNHLESIGDTIETNLLSLARSRLMKRLTVSDETVEMLRKLTDADIAALREAVQAVVEGDTDAADAVIRMKPRVRELADAAYAHQNERFFADEPNRLPLYAIEMDAIENLRRVYFFTKCIAKTIYDQREPQKKERVDVDDDIS